MYLIKRTDSFLRFVKKHKRNKELFDELDKKIERLKENPFSVGTRLSGILHKYLSTRLSKNFRPTFSIDENSQSVWLEALDHRKDVY